MLFCTSYIDDNDVYNNTTRVKRWIDYYKAKMNNLGVDALFLIDDGSPQIEAMQPINIHDVDSIPSTLASDVNFIHFKKNLGRPTWEDYQGWWRSFLFSFTIAERYGYDKIIHIESDFYVISDKIMEYISSLEGGWTSLFSPFHNFPETAIQIICKDQFSSFDKMRAEVIANGFRAPDCMPAELYFPFTKVEKSFIGDRIGQPEVFDKWIRNYKKGNDLDYIGQVHPSHRVGHYRTFFDIAYDF